MVHLVYCDNAGKSGERVIDRIIAGKKTMVVRGAAGRKIPHSRVNVGERLYFMEKGSAKVTATAVVSDVQNYQKLSENEIIELFSKNRNKLALTEKQELRPHKKFLVFVEFSGVELIAPPLAFEKEANMDDWLIISKIEDVLVGTSIPYSYEKSRFSKK